MAGAVGALRHRRERAAVRSGRLAPLGTGEVVAAPAGEDPISGWLARWVPEAPSSPTGRLAGALAAAPLTALGALGGLSTGGRWSWDRRRSCAVVRGGHGGAARLQEALGFGASAVGHVVIARPAKPSALLLDHEAVHVRQAERMGLLIVPVYAVLWARWGYRLHPLERAARLGASRAASARGEVRARP